MYAANVFKVRSDGETLEGISFYTTEAGAAVEWTVYYNLGTNKPALAPYTAGAVSVKGSETFPHSGYHTIKLADKNISLTKGTYFSVVLKVTNPTAKNPIVVERKIENASDFAAVHDGESWFSENGGTWWDGVNMLDGRKSVPMNACIKAFTINGDCYSAGTRITYYLVNVTEDHEFVEAYEANADTTYPTGMSPYDPDREYDPLFEEGYEPDVFWLASDGGEYPVYGPFVTSVDKEGYVYLNVQNLEYGTESGDLGSIPKGYYDFVYMSSEGNDGFVGNIELRLAASDFSEPDSGDITSPDVIIRYESRDVIVSRDVIHYLSGDVIVSREVIVQYVSRDVHAGVSSSSSGGCASGLGLAGLILISGLAASKKKR